MLLSVRLSVCLSYAASSETVTVEHQHEILCWWPYRSARSGRNGNEAVAGAVSEHSLGGCTVDTPHRTVIGGPGISFRRAIPCFESFVSDHCVLSMLQSGRRDGVCLHINSQGRRSK